MGLLTHHLILFSFMIQGKLRSREMFCVTGVAGWWLSQDQWVLRLPSKLSALSTAQVVSFHWLLHWSLSPSQPLSGKSVHLTQQFQFLLCFWVSGLGAGRGTVGTYWIFHFLFEKGFCFPSFDFMVFQYSYWVYFVYLDRLYFIYVVKICDPFHFSFFHIFLSRKQS